MGLEPWEKISARIASKVAKADKYLTQTKKSLAELLAEVEAIDKDVKFYVNLAIKIPGTRAQKILKNMPTWPENIQTYAEIIIQILGEEWDKEADSFPEELRSHIESLVRDLHEIIKISSETLTRNIQKLQEEPNDYRLKKELAEIVVSLVEKIKSAQFYAAAEEKIIEKDHIIMQQLLANKHLRDSAEIFRKIVEKILREIYATIVDQNNTNNQNIPRVKEAKAWVWSTKTNTTFYRHVTIPELPLDFLVVDITLDESKYYQLGINYVATEDRFYCDLRRNPFQPGSRVFGVDLHIKNGDYDSLSEITEDLRKLLVPLFYFKNVD